MSEQKLKLKMDEMDTQIQVMLSRFLDVFREKDNLQDMIARLADRNEALEEENNKLKYEYEDSKLNRDKPIPYKWTTKDGYMLMFCPKCEMGISNWYGYCHACGQKIGQGNPQPEMEIRKGKNCNGNSI